MAHQLLRNGLMSKNDSTFESENLIYRPIEKGDSRKIVEWRNNPEINKFFYDPKIITMDEHLNWFEKYQNNPNRYDYMIITKNSHKKIGVVGLQNIDHDAKSAEVAYMIGEITEQRKGYGSEAINTLIQFAHKTFGLRKEIAVIHKDNVASSQMIQHIGFCYKKEEYAKNFDAYQRKTGMIIGIRVDGNDKIGTGHIMRSLAIAEALREKGAIVIFITTDKTPRMIIQNRGFSVISLDSDWRFLNDEINKMIVVLKEYQIERLIIDTYQVTYNYFNELKPYSKLYYIDDYGDRRYSVDGVINYNITAELSDYQTLYRGTDTKLIIGTEYVPLRKEFQNLKPIRIKDNIKNVLITTGNTDPDEISTQIAKMIVATKKNSHINFHFICGHFYKNSEVLTHFAEKYQNIIVHKDVQRMSELMLKADLAISAGGSTLYELCACGVPTICFGIADNQDEAVNTFAQKGCMLNCDYKSETFYEDIKKRIKYLNRNKDKRYELHENLLKVTDGSGVYNLAEKIVEG